METYARPPDPLTNSGDMAKNWHSWKEDFIAFMKLTGCIDKPNETRANFLKNRIGKIGIDAIQQISFDNPQDKDDMDILIAKLENFFNPPKNEIIERYEFFTRSKKPNESIEEYINILREKAKTCNFKEVTDNIIRDTIIFSTRDYILREKFLETSNLDLRKIVAIYNDYTMNFEKMKAVKENKTEAKNFAQKAMFNNGKKVCWRCNLQHALGKCPAYGSKCAKCNEINHFTHCCRDFKTKANNNKTTFAANTFKQTEDNFKTVSDIKFVNAPKTSRISHDKITEQPIDVPNISQFINSNAALSKTKDPKTKRIWMVRKDGVIFTSAKKKNQILKCDTSNTSSKIKEDTESSCVLS